MHGSKYREDHSGGEGDYISCGGGSHSSGVFISSSDVVVFQRRQYYQLEARGNGTEEEISHLCGNWCSTLSFMIPPPIGRRDREWSILLRDRMVSFPYNAVQLAHKRTPTKNSPIAKEYQGD